MDVDTLCRQMGSWDPNLSFNAPPLQEVEANLKALPMMENFNVKEYGVDLTNCMLEHAMKEGSLVTDRENVREAMQLLAGAGAKTGVAVIVTLLV
jgi:hypothetical protein